MAMKNIFLLLALTNIVYFMWTGFGPLTPSRQSQALLQANPKMAGKRIILSNEIPILAITGSKPNNEVEHKALNRFEVMQSTNSNLNDLEKAIVSKSIDSALISATSVNLEKRTNHLLNQFKYDQILPELAAIPAVVDSIDLVSNNNKGPICYKIGPRVSKRSFRALVQGLYSHGFESDIASELLNLRTGYMVYFPAAENDLDSQNDIKLLRSKGIKDLWIHKKGELRGVISLGRFKVRDRAITMKKRLSEKGVNALIKATYAKKNGYFLFFRWLGPTSEFKTVLKNSKTSIDGLERISLKECG